MIASFLYISMHSDGLAWRDYKYFVCGNIVNLTQRMVIWRQSDNNRQRSGYSHDHIIEKSGGSSGFNHQEHQMGNAGIKVGGGLTRNVPSSGTTGVSPLFPQGVMMCGPERR
jgi:hypothetical protein